MSRPRMACLGSYLALYDRLNVRSCCGSKTCPPAHELKLGLSAVARLLPLHPDSVIVDGEGFVVELRFVCGGLHT